MGPRHQRSDDHRRAARAKYDFSDSYVSTKPALIVRGNDKTIKAFADLKGKKVVENLGTTYAKIAQDSGANIRRRVPPS